MRTHLHLTCVLTLGPLQLLAAYRLFQHNTPAVVLLSSFGTVYRQCSCECVSHDIFMHELKT